MDAAMRVTDEGAWFTQTRLVAFHPWAISVLKNESFHYFSMAGYEKARFLMVTSEMESCDLIHGYIMILEGIFRDCKPNFASAYYWVPKVDKRQTFLAQKV